MSQSPSVSQWLAPPSEAKAAKNIGMKLEYVSYWLTANVKHMALQIWYNLLLVLLKVGASSLDATDTPFFIHYENYQLLDLNLVVSSYVMSNSSLGINFDTLMN